jgi:hypothetical protein
VFIAKLLAFRQQIDSQKSIKIGKIFPGNYHTKAAPFIRLPSNTKIQVYTDKQDRHYRVPAVM